MTRSANPPVAASAVAHAERIRAGEAERAAAGPRTASGEQTTAERYAARILPGYRADEAARERARRDELRTRGVWVPSDDEEAEAEPEDVEDYDVEVDDEETEEEQPQTTAELYAARERVRIAAEREANRAAWQSSTASAWDRKPVI